MKNKRSRRKFLKTTAAGALGFHYFPGTLFGSNAPSNKLNIAAIGIAGRGGTNLRQCSSENIVALCDVDLGFASESIQQFPSANVYQDWRELFDKEKNIDAVVISTPDHTHATITMAALELGKHVYCEKPLTHTVYEARKIAEAARYYGVQTQMGNQGHSSDEIRLLKEYLDDGIIGDVTEVYAWTDRPVGGRPWSNFLVQAKPSDTPPVPDKLNWDLWLGPAQYRDYHPDYHPGKWRAWLDFGTGAMGDMGCHILDPSFWALDLGAPSVVQATSTHWEPGISTQTFPRASIVRMEFPARGSKPPVKLTWSDGRLLPPVPPEFKQGQKFPPSGAMLIGEHGVILHGSHGARDLQVLPESKMESYTPPKETIRRVTEGHHGDWLRACKDGKPASSTFDYGGPMTEMALLGMIAIRVKDQRLEWDAENLRFTNNDEANALFHKEYREGWSM